MLVHCENSRNTQRTFYQCFILFQVYITVDTLQWDTYCKQELIRPLWHCYIQWAYKIPVTAPCLKSFKWKIRVKSVWRSCNLNLASGYLRLDPCSECKISPLSSPRVCAFRHGRAETLPRTCGWRQWTLTDRLRCVWLRSHRSEDACCGSDWKVHSFVCECVRAVRIKCQGLLLCPRVKMG